MRRIDEHGSGLLGHARFKGLHIGGKGLGLARHRGKGAAVVGHVEPVFHKVGGKGQDFLAGIDDGLEDGIEGAGGTGAEQHVIGGELHTLIGGQPAGQGFPGPGSTGIGGVAKGKGLIAGGGKCPESVNHFPGSRQVGIAQGEVIDVFGTVLFLEFYSGFEHAANHGRVGHIALDCL